MYLKEVGVDNIQPGDVLGKDVDDLLTGNILVGKGVTLTEDVIERIRTKGIKRVFIKDYVLEERLNSKIADNYKAIEGKIMNTFNLVASGSEDINFSDEEGYFLKLAKGIGEEADIVGQLMLLRNNDDYTYIHSMAVGVLAAKLGDWLGFSDKERYQLTVAGIYHDIGKLKIPEEIRNKKGRLSDEEFEIMKTHSSHSYEILKKHSDFEEEILQAVLLHHEKMDGTGYPLGLSGDRIPKLARVLSICDIYSALTTDRVYRDKDSPFVAGSYIKQDSFSKLDPYMVRVFVDNISQFYIGNRVFLSDGREGVIVALDPVQKDSPLIRVGDEFVDLKSRRDLKILDVVV